MTRVPKETPSTVVGTQNEIKLWFVLPGPERPAAAEKFPPSGEAMI
jgi:hypothetical protein